MPKKPEWNITPEELKIYEKVQRAYLLEDAAYWFETEVEFGNYTEEERQYLWDNVDYDYLVYQYEDNYDNEIAACDAWSFFAGQYITELLAEFHNIRY